MTLSRRAFAALLALALCGCAETQNRGQTTFFRGAEKSGLTPDSVEWAKFVETFITQTFAARPHAGVSAGRHEFDGRIADFSPEGLRNEIARLHDARDR